MATTAKERVQAEVKDLDEKIYKAMDFVVKQKDKLNDAEMMLLNLQIAAMRKYKEILKARLSIWREL